MNWPVIILFGIGALALVIFLIIRNQKDEKEFEHHLNDDYPKPLHDRNDVETDEILK